MYITPDQEKQLKKMRQRFGTIQLQDEYLTQREQLFENYIDKEPLFKRIPKSPTSKFQLSVSNIQSQTTMPSSQRSQHRKILPKRRRESVSHQQPIFPKWMVERQDFIDLSKTKYFNPNFKIVSICEIESYKRDETQKTMVALYLQNLSLFKLMPFEMLYDLGGRLVAKHAKQGEMLCKQGDPGDCMYIIFKGEVDVDINGKVYKTFKDSEHMGRAALENDAPRNASLICTKETDYLALSRWDFQSCLNNIFKIERPKWRKFVDSIHFLKNFNAAKIEKLCDHLKGRFMSTKDCLYKVGDPVDNFYIVKNGVLVKTVVVDIEQSNRWPIGSKEWLSKTITKRLEIPLKYSAQSMIGYYEIVTAESLGLNSRTETIDAMEDSFVLFCPKSIFNDIFDAEDFKRFKEYHVKMHPTNFEKLIQKVKKEDELKKQDFNMIRQAISDNITSTTASQVESKQKKLQRVLDSAKDKLKLYRKTRHVLATQARTKVIASYYE